jgi:hypothetical protein
MQVVRFGKSILEYAFLLDSNFVSITRRKNSIPYENNGLFYGPVFFLSYANR